MSKTIQIVARLDQESVRSIDRMPGETRTEKLRTLVEQRGLVASLLDEQRAMLTQVQKSVANLHQQTHQNQPTAPTQNVAISAADMASIFQALALISAAVGKPMMSGEAANFCASKVREIASRK